MSNAVQFLNFIKFTIQSFCFVDVDQLHGKIEPTKVLERFWIDAEHGILRATLRRDHDRTKAGVQLEFHLDGHWFRVGRHGQLLYDQVALHNPTESVHYLSNVEFLHSRRDVNDVASINR